ncbi:hypothetical protein ACHWQZ_G006897 [Mnemiopsis leidyi]
MAATAAKLVESLEEQMREEFEVLNTTPSQFTFKNFLVYKHALSKITEHSTVFKPMLAGISSAYNSQITSLHTSNTMSNYDQDEEQQLNQADETIETLNQRVNQLKSTLASLDAENLNLTESIESMKELVADISAQSLLTEEDVFKNTVLNNMTLEQMTNVNLLSRELGKLEQSHQAMLDQQSSEFVMRDRFEEVRSMLFQKDEMKEKRQEEILALHQENPALKQLLEVLQSSEGLLFPDILDHVTGAMKTSGSFNKSQVVEFYDDEDPAKEKEAEVALAYIECLDEMLRDGNFRAAAVHAANSPNGFLRTMSTIEEFKTLSQGEGGVSPLFVYCDILMETVPLYSVPPADQSFECVDAALKENRLDLIAQWIANQYLTLHQPIADSLLANCQCRARCDCESGTLALAVFRSIGEHEMSMYCFARQGALYRAVHYAKTHQLGSDKLLTLLRDIPSTDLAALLVLEEGLNVGEVLTCLQESHNDNIFISLLRLLDESNDLKSVLLNDTSPGTVQWREFVDLCVELGESDIGEELQGFIISAEVLHKAVDSLSAAAD